MSGEKEYKQALSDINRGVSVLDSEMKKIKAVYKDNASSVEALAAKSDVLERTLHSQREKVETLRAALQKSAESYGESDKRTMSWQKSLNLAEAQVAETESAIRKNREEMDRAIKSTEEATDANGRYADAEKDVEESTMGLGSAVGELAGKLGVSLPDGAEAAINKLGAVDVGLVAAGGAAIAAATAFIKVEKSLFDLTVQAAASADDILTLVKTTGLAAETVQAFKYSANLLDVSFETISGSMTRLIGSMEKARDGNEELQDDFRELGVSVQNADGSLRNSEQVFYEVIDALGRIQNQTERDAMAMEIFGKSAQELNPLIEAGSETMKQYAEEAANAGYILDNDMLQALGDVDDAYQRLQLTQDAIKNQIAAEFAPAAESALTTFRDLINESGSAFVESGLVESLGNLLEELTSFLQPLTEMASIVNGPLKIGLESIRMVLATIKDALSEIVGMVQLVPQLLNGTPLNQTSLYTAAGKNPYQPNEKQIVWNSWLGNDYDRSTNTWSKPAAFSTADYNYNVKNGFFSGSYNDYVGFRSGINAGYNAIGDANWRGGATWVGENGPELLQLPRGTGIINNQASRKMGGDVYNITISAKDVKEFNDIVRIAKTRTTRARMG